MTHIVGITVGVDGAEDWSTVHNKLSGVAKDFSGDHYVTVHSTTVDAEDDDEFLPGEYADENTLVVVKKALRSTALTEVEVDRALVAMQNAGILFRQRR